MNPHSFRYCVFRLIRLYKTCNKMNETLKIDEQYYNELTIYMLQFFYVFWMYLYIMFCFQWICWSERHSVAKVSQNDCISNKNDCWHDNIHILRLDYHILKVRPPPPAISPQAEPLEDPPPYRLFWGYVQEFPNF